jgi:hypothetical protein
MEIDVYYTTQIDFEIRFDNQIIKVAAGDFHTKIVYTPKFNQVYNLELCCDTSAVIDHPVKVTKIIFDNFWIKENERVAFGKNVYSTAYLEYAKLKNIAVDLSVNDNHILFFMGKLVYSFSHPIFKLYETSLC